MTTDYLTYWGMSKPPFSLTPDPDMLYLSTQHSECLMRLKYAIFSQKGGALLVSDNAGNGKTSVLGRLKNDLNDYYGGRVRVVFIDHPTLTPIEMIGEIAHQLGSELHTTEKIRALNYLRDRLFTLYNENIKVVVIVDEGQMLKERPDILQELRILLNFCVTDAFLLTFIFSGQKPLDSILREMPEFWQRLPVRFFLKNLDYNDTKELIKYRLSRVGASPDIFTEDAFEGVYRYSEGCPRVICSVADLCLVVGYAKGVKRIGFVEVSTACRDMESSGDGFHYYAYIKSQDAEYLVDSKSRSAQNEPQLKTAPASSPDKTPAQKPDAAKPQARRSRSLLTDAIACPSCAEANPKDARFCRSCDSPLYKKCPHCQSLVELVTDTCPVCGENVPAGMRRLIEETRREFQPYDIMESGGAVWLKARGVDLDEGERVLLILPKGNLITAGPTVRWNTSNGRQERGECDFILTDRRIMIGLPDGVTIHELRRLDTCMTTTEGKLFGKRHQLYVGFSGRLFTFEFPHKQRKSRHLAETAATYIRSAMLK